MENRPDLPSIPEQGINRRSFTKQLMGSVLSFSLLETLVTQDMLANAVKPITDHWAIRMNEMCKDLRSETISQSLWQAQIEELLQTISLEELLRFIKLDQLTKGFVYPDLGVRTKGIRFPKLEGLPSQLAFYKKIFGVKKGRSIIPHGHKNMTSAHLVLKGEFALKHYEKLQDEGSHLIMKPTIDKTLVAGEASSISDEKNNIHWFRTLSETAFTFDVIVLDLNQQSYEINNIDPKNAEKIGNGLLRAQKLDVETALKKYGKEMHH